MQIWLQLIVEVPFLSLITLLYDKYGPFLYIIQLVLLARVWMHFITKFTVRNEVEKLFRSISQMLQPEVDE